MAQLLSQWRNLCTFGNVPRDGMAGAVFAKLDKVWDSSIVPLKLKSGLFLSLVVHVLLYNAECWSMR